jgi:photosystem II stability/assembly factor-like uncharacterized protein
MTVRIRIALALAVLAAAVFAIPPAGPSAGPKPALTGADAAALESILEEEMPEDMYLFSRTATGASANLDAFTIPAAQAAAVAKTTKQEQPKLSAARWRFKGPANIGARVVDMAADPVLHDTLYIAAASGGIWRSRDGGMTYAPVWPVDYPQAMGALTVGPDGALWAGTGESNPGGGSLTYGGGGVYVSRNRGKTWTNVGLEKTSRIGRIAVDPSNPRHVFVAATGNLFAPGGDRGLYETRDGGRHWRLAAKGDNDTTGAVDVAIDPQNPNNVIATMWDAIRYPDRRIYNGVGSGIYRSTDGGATFARLGLPNGLPPALSSIGRIGVAFAPSDPSRVYAIYANNDLGPFEGWFLSVDGGAHWVAPPGAIATLLQSQSVYGWWFGRIFVDPKDPMHVFLTGLTLSESIDGGLSFPIQQVQQHVDHHAMAWDPHRPGRVWNGNDGGVYRSDDNGADMSWTHAKVMPWNQLFTLDVSQQDPSRINAGLQDNGSVRSWGDEAGWNDYAGGDGVQNVINPLDMQNVFACSQYGACERSDDGGDSLGGMTKTGTRDGWRTPIEFVPGSGDLMYWAGDTMNESADRGKTWSATGPDLGKLDPGTEINPLYAAHYGTVQAIGVNPADPRFIYAGTDNGFLWKRAPENYDWTEITPAPGRWVTAIAVEPRDPNKLYVSYSGFREADHRPYVSFSDSAGAKWRDVSRGLPEAPVNDLVLVGKTLYAATDLGVYVTKTTRIRWYRLGAGLPNCPVNDLRYVAKNRTIYAGTFGRGVWSIVPPAF